jgi:hypothetical protein
MALTFKYVSLPHVWPGRQRPPGWKGVKGPFKITTWAPVERFLMSELEKLGARDVTIAIDVPNPSHWRMDGGLRSDARAMTPRVIVAFTRRDGVRLTFPCDSYNDWQTNVYAIAKSLEMLRAIDRYGVTQGDQQYVGFRALPPGAAATLTPEAAAEIIAKHSSIPAQAILEYPVVGAVAIRTAQSKTHPDRGGSSSDFTEVQKAADVIAKLAGDLA